MPAVEGSQVRLAEVVALLSLGTDLGLGQPMEHMIRACLLALRLADRLGFEDGERGTLYYSGLLAWVGCHTDAYEQAKWFGDDLSLKRDAHYGYDFGRPREAAAFMLKNIGGPGRPLVERARVGVAFLGDGRRAIESLAENHYRATDELAVRLRLSDEVRESLRQSYERWDGKGAYKLKGEEIALSSRLMNLADVVEVFQRTRGLEAALVGRASYVHDLGRLGVSNAIWDKRGPLNASEVERVRLHPYLSERMLSFSSALAPIGALAVQHHERLDGSGYPRGLSDGMITPAARLLAAADVYQALTEPRPHRPARTREEAADIVRAEVSEGRLDGDAASAVLRAAGHRVLRRREGPMRLTAREVEVLRLLARGLSNKEIAQQLVISPKTAGSHVEIIYAKSGASNRAQASLFAVKHGLLADAYP